HRATGMALYGGALIVAGWAVSLASGPGAYEAYVALLNSIPGKVVMFGLTVSVFYHLANGVRHLAWDLGQGYAPNAAGPAPPAARGRDALRRRRRGGGVARRKGDAMSDFQPPLRRARGLGAAKHGVGHFIGQRVSAAALVLLVLWGVFAALTLSKGDYATATT